MPQYDLHSHSTASDGSLSPTDLVHKAAAAGVAVLALTDHDSTAGLDEAEQAAEQYDLHVLPGLEASVTWNGQVIHIVGLGVDRANKALQDGLDNALRFREWRADEIGRRLHEELGIEGAAQAARKLAVGGLVSRTHFARFLVQQGYAKDMRQVFKRFLTRGKPGYVAGDWALLSDAVKWINDAGGIAVVAHPARYGLTRTKLMQLMEAFQAAGGRGLEVVCGSHGKDDVQKMAGIARHCGLMASAGSDYHGPEQVYLKLGKLADLPPGLTPVWTADEIRQHFPS